MALCKDCCARNGEDACLIGQTSVMLPAGGLGCALKESVVEQRMGISKPLTNADRIRAMSDEELAMFIYSGCDGLECTGKSCRECWLSWLKKEEFGPKEMPWISPTGKEADNG